MLAKEAHLMVLKLLPVLLQVDKQILHRKKIKDPSGKVPY